VFKTLSTWDEKNKIHQANENTRKDAENTSPKCIQQPIRRNHNSRFTCLEEEATA